MLFKRAWAFHVLYIFLGYVTVETIKLTTTSVWLAAHPNYVSVIPILKFDL